MSAAQTLLTTGLHHLAQAGQGLYQRLERCQERDSSYIKTCIQMHRSVLDCAPDPERHRHTRNYFLLFLRRVLPSGPLASPPLVASPPEVWPDAFFLCCTGIHSSS